MTVLRRLGLGLCALVVMAPALLLFRPAQGARPADAFVAGSQLVTLRVGGLARDYRLFLPAGGGHARPLLLALHQLHGSALSWERHSGLDAGAAAAGVVVAYPDGVGESWNAGTCCQPAAGRGIDDVAFLRAVIADVARRTSIDPSRVAVTGFSNGALMSYRLVCSAADVVRVAVAVAGDLVAGRCEPSRPVSVLHVHGGRDPVIPVAGVARSPLDPAGFPSARTSIGLVATADGCVTGADSRAGPLSVWRANGCAGNSRVELIVSSSLTHTYPAGRGPAASGLDMTTLTWEFLRTVWQ
ncbi:MAG: polyhydroxybutyrate depolymerase [Frankiaceae bacterium]|nr:polyhydroxybutyrate depolymerase [Frankiaceae bacterium]